MFWFDLCYDCCCSVALFVDQPKLETVELLRDPAEWAYFTHIFIAADICMFFLLLFSQQPNIPCGSPHAWESVQNVLSILYGFFFTSFAYILCEIEKPDFSDLLASQYYCKKIFITFLTMMQPIQFRTRRFLGNWIVSASYMMNWCGLAENWKYTYMNSERGQMNLGIIFNTISSEFAQFSYQRVAFHHAPINFPNLKCNEKGKYLNVITDPMCDPKKFVWIFSYKIFRG